MANDTPQQRTKAPEQYLFGLLKTYRRPTFLHERFERLVALILSGAIGVIIIISLIQVIRTIFMMLVVGALDPLDHTVFQSVFGMIMTLLIAMGFLHSVVRMAVRNDSLIQAKTLLLIGLLALTRKFIILSPSETDPDKIAALAGATLALGAVYWLLRERDDRLQMRQDEEENSRTDTSI
ncbi:MAG: phosphate-starvation-inducible family protein [Burkholderiaceae bacterium]|nr:phosphate-starvation-inducible family protein [Burkholderiaceae bacterium]